MTVDKEGSTVEAEIGRLTDLSPSELKELWRQLYGLAPPKHISRQLLAKAIGYKLQERVHGGLSPTTKRRLREIAGAVRDGRQDDVVRNSRIRPGTQLIRAWQGTTHVVNVLSDGFEWQGAKHTSLSSLAKSITGTNWNGYIFFGVKRRPTTNKNAKGQRQATHDEQIAVADKILSSDLQINGEANA